MVNKSTAIADVRQQLDVMLGKFAIVLPKHIPAERFRSVVLTAIENNPKLLNVERRSLWNACMRAAQDGLLPDGRLGALVIYDDKKRGLIAQWLPMIAGIRQKVRNSGEIATWEVHVVHERDLYDYELGDAPKITHVPVRGERGPIVAAYSIARLKTGELSREWMWIDEIQQIREKRSKATSEQSPWFTDFSEMCKKTVAKRHAKVLPMSTDLDDLLRRDDEAFGGPEEPVAESQKGRPGRPSRNLTDAMDMISSLPEGAGNGHDEALEIDDHTGEIIEHSASDEPNKSYEG